MCMQIRTHRPAITQNHARPSLVVRPFSSRREPISTHHMRPWLPERRAKHGTAARSIPGSGAAPAPRPRNAYYAQLHPKPPPPDAWRRYNFGELSRGR